MNNFYGMLVKHEGCCEIFEQVNLTSGTPLDGKLYYWKRTDMDKVHGPFRDIEKAQIHHDVFMAAKVSKSNVIFVDFGAKRRIA